MKLPTSRKCYQLVEFIGAFDHLSSLTVYLYQNQNPKNQKTRKMSSSEDSFFWFIMLPAAAVTLNRGSRSDRPLYHVTTPIRAGLRRSRNSDSLNHCRDIAMLKFQQQQNQIMAFAILNIKLKFLCAHAVQSGPGSLPATFRCDAAIFKIF